MTRRLVRVEDIASRGRYALSTGPFGSAISAQFFRSTGVPVLRGSNLSNEVGTRLSDDGLAFIDADLASRFARSVARRGDLVFTCWGTIDQVGLVDQRAKYDEYVVSNKQMKLTPDDRLACSLFLYYYFSSPEVRESIIASGIGSSVPGFNLGQLRSMEVLLPPLDEQRAIAEVLGALDDKIELNRQMNHTLEEMASALFERMMLAVDDDPNAEVSVQALIDRQWLVVGDGYRAKNDELDATGLPFARAGNIDSGFLFANAELLGWPAVERAGAKVSVPLDVVFTSKGTVGRFAFVGPTTPKFAYSPQLCFWRSTNPAALSPYFLYHWMRSRRFLEQVDAVKGQTDMADYVSLTDQRLMKVAMPAAALHCRLRDEVAPLWDLHFANTDESKTLAALRDTLLPKLLSGEVRLKQAEKVVEAVL